MAVEYLDYTAEAVAAARSALIELTHILGEYRDETVLVGGWIPELLLPSGEDRHIGSIDVDLALNHKELTAAGYQMIGEILRKHGYEKDARQPFIFRKQVHGHIVQVDFLAGEYGGTGRGHRTQKAMDMQPRKARGCDLAFEIPPEEIPIQGKLPDGALDEVKVKVASVVPFLVMKGMAMEDRRKPKDAYDIYFVLRHYPGGIDALVEAFKPHLRLALVKEGLKKIAAKFASVDHLGPRDAAAAYADPDDEQRSIRQRDAFELVNYLIQKLNVR